MMRKIMWIWLIAMMVLLLVGCGESEVWTIPEAGAVGGYEIKTEAMRCTVMANGTHKFSRFHSEADGTTIEFYASPTEMVLLHTVDGVTQYHRETFEERGQVYENPLGRVLDNLRALEFGFQETVDGISVYEALRTEQRVEQEQISYMAYVLEMTWTDGNPYVFRYYDYVDGSELISAEAPSEINPLLVADTPWVIDLDGLCVRNTKTGQTVALSIVSKGEGMGLSPIGESVTVEHTTTIQAFVSQDTGMLERLKYEDGADVTILYEAEIAKPEITADMTEMDSETLQLAMMLVYAMETLI